MGNLLSKDNPQQDDLGMYAAKNAAASASEAKTGAGIYFLENSVKKDAFTAKNKNFGYYYRLPMPRSIPLILRMKYGNLKTENWSKRLIFKKGQHFSGKDGLIYASKEAAKKSQLNPDQGAYTYMNGKCAYRALWNRQTVTADGKSIVNADTRRNNTYLLTIKAFQGLGMPWDPSDPKDPYLPKPKILLNRQIQKIRISRKKKPICVSRPKYSNGTSFHVMSFWSNFSIRLLINSACNFLHSCEREEEFFLFFLQSTNSLVSNC